MQAQMSDHVSWNAMLLVAVAVAVIIGLVALIAVLAAIARNGGGAVVAAGLCLLLGFGGMVMMWMLSGVGYESAPMPVAMPVMETTVERKDWIEIHPEVSETHDTYSVKNALVAEVTAESFDVEDVDNEPSGDLPAPAEITRAEINLSTLPEEYPDWIDETEPVWDSNKQTWTTTVMIGPYETEADCQKNRDSELREAAKQYALWHAARIADVDETIANYEPTRLPDVQADLERYGNSMHGRGADGDGLNGYSHATYSQGHVRELYTTQVKTGVSEEPWSVAFARVEFDRAFQHQVDRHVRHSMSVNRAIKVGGIWGLALLGMVATLGGLKLTGKSNAAAIVMPVSADAVVASEDEASRDVLFTRKRNNLILAPIVCTIIYLFTCANFDSARPLSVHFWPMWVWLGCGIGFVQSFVPKK